MAKKAENQKIDEVLEEIMKNQYANDTHRFAVIMKGFYDSFLNGGFPEEMARELVVTLVSNVVRQAKES